ncbi:MAG: hypothetical protein QMB41_02205, partial [Rhodospirillales bacterium]
NYARGDDWFYLADNFTCHTDAQWLWEIYVSMGEACSLVMGLLLNVTPMQLIKVMLRCNLL